MTPVYPFSSRRWPTKHFVNHSEAKVSKMTVYSARAQDGPQEMERD